MKNDLQIAESGLINAVRNGDHQAFDQIFQKYGSALFAFVSSIIKDNSVTEEIVQDVFLKIWKKKKDLKPELSFKSYLFKIALNTTRKYYRKKLQDEKYRQDIAITISTNPSLEMNFIDYKNLLEYVDRLINKLPKARRDIFILSRKDGLKNGEIAKKMNITEQTVKNQLVAAQKFLRAEAKKDNNELGFLFFTFFYKI